MAISAAKDALLAALSSASEAAAASARELATERAAAFTATARVADLEAELAAVRHDRDALNLAAAGFVEAVVMKGKAEKAVALVEAAQAEAKSLREQLVAAVLRAETSESSVTSAKKEAAEERAAADTLRASLAAEASRGAAGGGSELKEKLLAARAEARSLRSELDKLTAKGSRR